jgi:hypothetical protein
MNEMQFNHLIPGQILSQLSVKKDLTDTSLELFGSDV